MFSYILQRHIPTKLRDQAQSLLQATAFLIGSWGPFLIYEFNDQYQINVTVLGLLYVFCGLVTIFLPFETREEPWMHQIKNNN